MYDSTGRPGPTNIGPDAEDTVREGPEETGQVTGQTIQVDGGAVEADGYYSDDDMGDDEIDLSFLDEDMDLL